MHNFLMKSTNDTVQVSDLDDILHSVKKIK